MIKTALTIIIVVFLHCISIEGIAQADTHNWMPVPKSWKDSQSNFVLNADFTVGIEGVATDKLQAYSSRFMRRLDWKTGLFFNQAKVTANVKNPDLLITIRRAGQIELGEDESYQLEVSKDQINLVAETDIGAMRGLETLLQLLSNDNGTYHFKGIFVDDAPRFSWRGLMIDVARHFQPVHVIKRNIDAMAAVKMNVLHLHLVDDHGYRIESKVFPQLNEKSSEGQYFTHNQIRELVSYAADRGIRVIPEIDIPGHASAFLTAFPELGSAPGPYKLQNTSGIFDPTLDPTNEETYVFLNKLFTEVTSLFPDAYFHVGGDENEGKHWNENPAIRKFMSERKLKDIHALQNYFITRVQKQLKSLGKKTMGWDEILNEDLPKDAVIHSWRGISSLKSASQKGYKCLLSNGFYIDLMKRASDHYVVDPLPKGLNLSTEQEQNILGGEATMWSELVVPETIDSRIWPRTAAIAERLWSPGSVRDVPDMYRRLEAISFQLEQLGLTHVSSRQALMRNIAGGGDIAPVEILADVSEPLEGYSRNPGGDIYKFHYAFNRFADITLADAPSARIFGNLIKEYQQHKKEETKQEIVKWLSLWNKNHADILNLIEKSPALAEVKQLSLNLQTIAKLGLEVLALKSRSYTIQERQEWYESAMRSLDKAKVHGARTELQVVEPIRALIKLEAAQIIASRASGKMKIDGRLNDWADAEWDFFVPSMVRGWNDTCYYALQWDQKNLYFAFKVTNGNLQASKSNRDEKGLHLDDGVEILIDTKNDKTVDWQKDDLAYHINILNAIMDDRGLDVKGEYDNSWNGKAKSKVTVNGTINNPNDRDSGYWVEFAIDWKELGQKPRPNLAIMGINVCVNDQDDLHQEYRYYDFMRLSIFHAPAGFADLVLAE